MDAENKLLEQKLKEAEDNPVKREAEISKLTKDHDEEVKRLKKERDDVEAKANSSESNSLSALGTSYMKLDGVFSRAATLQCALPFTVHTPARCCLHCVFCRLGV